MDRSTIVFLIALLVLGAPLGPALADGDCIDYEIYPHLVGALDTDDYARDVVVDGPYAYLVDESQGLLIIDITDPTAPAVVGSVDQAGTWTSVAVRDRWAYVTTTHDGLLVIDILDPTEPEIVDSLDLPFAIGDIERLGSIAYVLTDEASLHVIDVTYAYMPTSLATVPLPGTPWDLAVDGDRIVVALGGDGVCLLDASTPELPVNMGVFPLAGSTSRVALAGEVAWVGNSLDGVQTLYALEIDSFSGFTVVGQVPAYTGRIAVDGSWVFVASYSGDIFVVDGADPTAPRVVNRVQTLYGATGIVTAPGLLCLANGPRGFSVLAYGELEQPAPAGLQPFPGAAVGVSASGGEAFAACGNVGVRWVDASDPVDPRLITTIPTLNSASDAWYRAPYLFVADFQYFLAFDLSDPDDPELLPWLNLPSMGLGSARAVVVEGDNAFVASYLGLVVIDVSDPQALAIRGYLGLADPAIDLELGGDLAYLGGGSRLKIVDIGDPADPTLVSQVEVGSPIRGLGLWEDRVVVAHGQEVLSVVDVAAPQLPVVVGEVKLPGSAQDVVVRDGIAYVAGEFAGMLVVDVTDMAAPRSIGALFDPSRSEAVGLALLPDAVAVALDMEGLLLAWPSCVDITAVETPSAAGALARPAVSSRPNPFNPATEIVLAVPRDGTGSLRIHDARGRLVRTLHTGPLAAGEAVFNWNGRDDAGRGLPSGVYLCRLEIGGQVACRKVALLR